jgi:MOSC domain-containing protein YiiM
MKPLDQVEAVAGRGLDGDRYAVGGGTYSERPGTGRQVTLIEAEAVAAVNDLGLELEASETRRNVVTRGVPLNHLVGQEFAVGEVVLRGTRLCEPCKPLEEGTRPGIRQALLHRAGLRADIVRGGTIHVGDAIHPC